MTATGVTRPRGLFLFSQTFSQAMGIETDGLNLFTGVADGKKLKSSFVRQKALLVE